MNTVCRYGNSSCATSHAGHALVYVRTYARVHPSVHFRLSLLHTDYRETRTSNRKEKKKDESISRLVTPGCRRCQFDPIKKKLGRQGPIISPPCSPARIACQLCVSLSLCPRRPAAASERAERAGAASGCGVPPRGADENDAAATPLASHELIYA